MSSEPPPSDQNQPAAVNVEPALSTINNLRLHVQQIQLLVKHHESHTSPSDDKKEADIEEAGGGGGAGSGCFSLKASAKRVPAAAKVGKVKGEGGGGSRFSLFRGGASAAGKAGGSPSPKDGVLAAEIPEVKPGQVTEKGGAGEIGPVNGSGDCGSSTGEKAAGNSGGKDGRVPEVKPGPVTEAKAAGYSNGDHAGTGPGKKAIDEPSSKDGSVPVEILEVKPGAETEAKANQNGEGNSGGGRAAVNGHRDGGGNSAASKEEVKPEEAAAGSPKRPASSNKEGSNSSQANGSVANGGAADSNVKKGPSSASSTKPHNDTRKVSNQTEKLLRDLNNIKSELLKLKSLETQFQELEDPVKKLEEVLKGQEDKAPNFTSLAFHKELQDLADMVKGVKNHMPGHSAPATNAEKHNVDDETKFQDYKLLGKDSVPKMMERVQGTSCFEGFREDFKGAFAGLDLQSKLCLCCFSIFPENAVVHKKLLVYWWIGEGLVDSQLPADNEKKAADTGKKAADKGKKAADKGKKAADIAKKAADMAKKAADMAKKAADKVKMAADAAKKAVDMGTKAGDVGNKAATFGNKTANKVIMELCSKGFIEPVLKKQKLCGFRMDPLVRFVLISTAEKLGFFNFDQMGIPTADFSSSHRACLVQNHEGNFSKKDLTSEKESGPSNKEKVAESTNGVGDSSKEKKMDHLHTLFNVNDPYPDFKLDWFVKLRMLNVLYLGGWQGSKGPHIEVEGTEFLRGLRNMKYLKFLSLQGISRINDLPDSLCALTKLKILDLNACHHLESLPKQLGELKNLTHLDISECYLLDHIPKGLGQLSQLQVLKGFVIGGSGDNKESCTLDDLKGLKNLRKLSITSSRDNFPLEKEVDVLQGFEHLKSLTIAWGGKSSKAEAGAVRPDDGKAKNKDERGTSIEQQKGGRSSAEQMGSAKKGVSIPPVVPGNAAEQKGDKGERAKQSVAGPKEEDIGERGVQHDASVKSSETIQSRPSAKPGRTGKALWLLARFKLQLALRALGLEKLELQCCPLSEAPSWMLKGKLKPRKKLYIRGGDLRTLTDGKGTPGQWTVKILCLKYLADLEMNWCQLQVLFPHLAYLEKSLCPKLTYFPCNASGVWISRNQELLDKAKQDFSWSFLK